MSDYWIQTYKGIHFDLFDPQPEMIDIEDIAHALARIYRFTGHGLKYTVAQHSVLVSYRVPLDLAYQGLMHDAHEAYMGDISSPLKRASFWITTYEEFLAGRIREAFGLPAELDPLVEKTDLEVLLGEKAINFKDNMDWGVDAKPSKYAIPPILSCETSEADFLGRYWQLRRREGI